MRLAGDILLALIGGCFLLLGLLLPMGYAMAESSNLGLLIGAMATLIVIGLALIALVRAASR